MCETNNIFHRAANAVDMILTSTLSLSITLEETNSSAYNLDF